MECKTCGSRRPVAKRKDLDAGGKDKEEKSPRSKYQVKDKNGRVQTFGSKLEAQSFYVRRGMGPVTRV